MIKSDVRLQFIYNLLYSDFSQFLSTERTVLEILVRGVLALFICANVKIQTLIRPVIFMYAHCYGGTSTAAAAPDMNFFVAGS